MKNDSEIVVTNCGGASRTAFHETLCDIPVRVRRTSPFRLQISRVVSRDFWCKQSAKVPSHKNKADFDTMSVAELKKYLHEQGISASG